MINFIEALGDFLNPSVEVNAPAGGLVDLRVYSVDYSVINVSKILEDLPQINDQMERRVSGIARSSDTVLASTVELDAEALEIHDRAKLMREERDAQITREMALGTDQDTIILRENAEDDIARIKVGNDMMAAQTQIEQAIQDKENELRASQEKIAEINKTLNALYAENSQFTIAA